MFAAAAYFENLKFTVAEPAKVTAAYHVSIPGFDSFADLIR